MKATYLWLVLAIAAPPEESARVTVASKAFTESAILGEIVAQLVAQHHLDVHHMDQLGGTGLVWSALKSGEVDLYPEYTGTIARDILAQPGINSPAALREALARHGIDMSAPLGFENSYELGMPRALADRLQIRTISDLRAHPELRMAFSPEFLDRQDGWPGLRRRYRLPQRDVRPMEHALAYRAAAAGEVDVIDIYGTDANLRQFDLQVLEDDLRFFPEYDAVLLYRSDLPDRVPQILEVIKQVEGRISRQEMIDLNVLVDVAASTPRMAASEFLRSEGLASTALQATTRWARITRYTLEHLWLVLISLTATIVCAVPMGVMAAKQPATRHVLLSAAEVVQTIPGLALLVLLITPLGMLNLRMTGSTPAIIALFLYSLLPVLRNTYTALRDIPQPLRESAAALGLTASAQLWRIELPLASSMILAGIKTAAVINVGYATLGALIGAGGYGAPILQGLYRNNIVTMLEGAVPAAILALCVKWLFELAERAIVPRGLRLH